MKCPFCGATDDKVVDSRESREGEVIRRRRECAGCGRRFTSYETIEEIPYMVVKNDGRRETFDRKKLRAPGDALVFGKESVGLPKDLLAQYPDATSRHPDARCGAVAEPLERREHRALRVPPKNGRPRRPLPRGLKREREETGRSEDQEGKSSGSKGEPEHGSSEKPSRAARRRQANHGTRRPSPRSSAAS